jgi:4-hydroxy-2-oxoheptanedioate aldolase
LSRAGQFGNLTGYPKSADEQICLIVQLETRAGIDALDKMLAEDGIDGIFIGPSDLAADMGYLGELNAPIVQQTIADALKRISASGKAAGVLSLKDSETPVHLENGARMIGIASDVREFNAALQKKVQTWCDKT